ncbi:putative membrane protein [Leptospira inadai serovar Lyme str. 10]|uniref:Membrane-bound metal-dependent hydrolase n=2 Tax=Leptospira inadai serovar Lyme TaxID=293084 RepID=A0ABX4YHF8_9LEPT|nr:hypothetical protein [Leptospira inadai]EQA37417.1 putative membrane protein [Leptospira inadai serovar Lyme str. 10]PNV74695.1 hypothetical protein BES34_011990 [Leptospira inadai serovar Lyme]
MFIGHYSVSFALKKAEPKTPLWTTLVGVQFVDILFMIFILFGIEGVRFVPGFTEMNNFDLFFMPYTHSLVAGILWGILIFFLSKYVLLKSKPYDSKTKTKISFLIGISVLSHYFADLLMHTPDLPIFWDPGPKIGFGLWKNRVLSITLEIIVTLVGLILYFRATKPGSTFAGKYGMQFFAAFLILLAIVTPFFPPPTSVPDFSAQALFGYIVIAALGGWLDTKRIAKDS